ncbi:unnamed protein product [Mytilus coruscus]|uniref:Mab-21-like HhH/H2TH-like domain-containing protein n=1 Tax=Mytilus coruscus TaxID=42192 RepID=A0A6J8B6C2_MYTCO|nr:unnamed protein product [Mytilus coruscus]
MNGNSTNQNNSDDGNIFGMRKIPYLEIYGVKRFPYRGRRKYTPLLYQSFDGGMIISNDVFGLTIRQFERLYKACLERRKTKEQWILNLRYPDKSSNNYLEYLQNCIDNNTDHLLWHRNESREKYLYELLVDRVGTEIDIRTRQRLFITIDIIHNAYSTGYTKISSGSLAEGLDLPGSDIDIMYLRNDTDVIQNVRNIKHPLQCTKLAMETDIDHPGFTRLRLVAVKTGESFFVPRERRYAGVDNFIDRHKNSDVIIDYGCLIVPIGPKNSSNDEGLWRLSFSVAEKILVHSFNFTQLLCYGLLKLTLKRIINTNNDVKELLCSYFLKTALFWVSEEEDIDTFRLPKLYYCFSLCLDRLISWVNICYCPNYFIPEHNMFLEKINQTNKTILILVLESIKFGGIDRLITNLFQYENENPRLSSTKSELSFEIIDNLFYRIAGIKVEPTDISKCFKGLAFTKSFMKSESSTFIIDVCEYYYAEINQSIAQLLPTPKSKGSIYNIHERFHRHLQDGIKTDAVSGWLLYASFYYAIEQYDVTLSLTDYVLSRCTPDMMKNRGKIQKIQSVHFKLTLIERMKISYAHLGFYIKHSSLIPEELQLGEVFHLCNTACCFVTLS